MTVVGPKNWDDAITEENRMKKPLATLTVVAALILVSVAAHAQMIAFSWSPNAVTYTDSGQYPPTTFLAPLNNGATSLAFTTAGPRQWVQITYSATCNVRGNANANYNGVFNAYNGYMGINLTVDGNTTYPAYNGALFCALADLGLPNGSFTTGVYHAFIPVTAGKHSVTAQMYINQFGTNYLGTSTDSWTLSDGRIVVEK